MKSLSNYEIDDFMRITMPLYFMGTFDQDSLPNPRDKLPWCTIINTERDTKSTVGHWVAMVMDRTGHAHYFDSYGFPPQFDSWKSYLLYYDKNNNYSFSSAAIQPLDTNICGHLCIEFCRRRLTNRYRTLTDTALAKTINLTRAVDNYNKEKK